MNHEPNGSRHLTSRGYWEDLHSNVGVTDTPSRHLLGPRARIWMRRFRRNYTDDLLWNVIYRRYLGSAPGRRLLEIGSAPGDHLLALHARLGFDPYGVDFTEHGWAANRRLFERNGLDPSHVIHSDFLSDGFQGQYGDQFDVVISRGVLEHFDPPEPAVVKHVTLLRRGGTLLVMIPNLRGFNGLLQRAMKGDLMPLHNLAIMKAARFASLFERLDLQSQYCGYLGVF